MLSTHYYLSVRRENAEDYFQDHRAAWDVTHDSAYKRIFSQCMKTTFNNMRWIVTSNNFTKGMDVALAMNKVQGTTRRRSATRWCETKSRYERMTIMSSDPRTFFDFGLAVRMFYLGNRKPHTHRRSAACVFAPAFCTSRGVSFWS